MNKIFKGYIWVSVLLSSVSLNTLASPQKITGDHKENSSIHPETNFKDEDGNKKDHDHSNTSAHHGK